MNLNDFVYVRLTSEGEAHFVAAHEKLGMDPARIKANAMQPDGWWKFTLHQLMDNFGNKSSAGDPSLFVDNEVLLERPGAEKVEAATPVVLAVQFELLSAARGSVVPLSTTDGTPVVLRLPTVDEALAMNARALEYLAKSGLPIPRPMTRALAESLVSPIF